MKGIVLSLLVLCSSAAAHGFDYCTLNCKEVQSTMCKYKTETPGRLCKNYEQHFLTAKEKIEILDKHNEMRARVARGEVPNHPAALDLKDLTWSSEDEIIARRWALQCDYEHDPCRKTKDGQWAGQNLAVASSSAGYAGLHLSQVQKWFDEHELYKPKKENLYPEGLDEDIGHYTQLVWAKSRHIGCERTYFYYDAGLYKDNPGTELLVCVYSPAGNRLGTQVYQPVNQTAFGVKSESCVFTMFVSVVIALKSGRLEAA